MKERSLVTCFLMSLFVVMWIYYHGFNGKSHLNRYDSTVYQEDDWNQVDFVPLTAQRLTEAGTTIPCKSHQNQGDSNSNQLKNYWDGVDFDSLPAQKLMEYVSWKNEAACKRIIPTGGKWYPPVLDM